VSSRNLLKNPCFQAIDLGSPMPDSPHAVSVALPRWEDVIAYEEKIPSCIQALKTVYPRFGLNPLVASVARKLLKEKALAGWSAWPYQHLANAEKAKKYCIDSTSEAKAFIQKELGLQCLLTDPKATPAARSFWQHAGLGASSRLAAIATSKEKCPASSVGAKAKNQIKRRLANIYSCLPKNIFLRPSGMAALHSALEVIETFNPKTATLQLGFPYVDVLKLPKVIFSGSDLLLSTNQQIIENQLDKKKPSAVIVEIPSNPLLRCVDLPLIAKLAHSRNIPVIVDDTVGSSLNVNTIPYADLIFSSLTKSFAGRGDILAGSLIISPESKWEKEFHQILSKNNYSDLSDPDAIALEEASRDVQERLSRLNSACIALKNKLESHPAVSRVLHPQGCKNFRSIMKAEAGFGCLLSFELKGGIEAVKNFYDNVEICKGPSLGTDFTLMCPYVLLAHYGELRWANDCGVPETLLRVSVGLEDPETLWNRFKKTLDK
tara:strand:- start:253 stop:1725 length:1473 start_codon:yes stop_codon:yes gene_type:complete